MVKIEDEEAKRIANEHSRWLMALLEHVYNDAFVHGFKHGYKYAKEVEKDEQHL